VRSWSARLELCHQLVQTQLTEVRLLHDLRFLARLCRRLAVRHRHFDLPEQVHYLLRLIPLASCHLSSSRASFLRSSLAQNSPGTPHSSRSAKSPVGSEHTYGTCVLEWRTKRLRIYSRIARSTASFVVSLQRADMSELFCGSQSVDSNECQVFGEVILPIPALNGIKAQIHLSTNDLKASCRIVGLSATVSSDA